MKTKITFFFLYISTWAVSTDATHLKFSHPVHPVYCHKKTTQTTFISQQPTAPFPSCFGFWQQVFSTLFFFFNEMRRFISFFVSKHGWWCWLVDVYGQSRCSNSTYAIWMEITYLRLVAFHIRIYTYCLLSGQYPTSLCVIIDEKKRQPFNKMIVVVYGSVAFSP